jgi:choline-glycine betaine transporter
MDVLFLLPVHPWWSQPVWAPVLIASGMVGVGLVLFGSAERTPHA